MNEAIWLKDEFGFTCKMGEALLTVEKTAYRKYSFWGHLGGRCILYGEATSEYLAKANALNKVRSLGQKVTL